MSGRLYIIATPIGNLGDLTQRAREALGKSELILAEDTRVTLRLLNHLGLKKRLLSCHEFNEASRLDLLEELANRDASVAVVSDAGSPLVSDPGFQLVRRAIALGMQTIPVPGPSAFLLALVGSGLPCDRFAFEGFLPDRAGERKRKLEKAQNDERTLVFYVSPHDLEKVLDDLINVLGDRSACLARELTKLYEEFLRGPLSELKQRVSTGSVRGECVLVVAGAPTQAPVRADDQTVLKELISRLDSGSGLKEASAAVAEQFGWRKSEVYKLGLKHIG